MCEYVYVDPSPPNCGECGVQTCSGLAGWWCRPDDTKCSGGKVCDAGNKCSCPSGTSWDGIKCSTTSPPPACTNPSSYTNSNNCQSAGCYWCAPPSYSGFCAADSASCQGCTKDSDCKSSCDTSGCNLNIYKCLYGKCAYSGTSTFCGYGTKGCAGGTTCDPAAGSCGTGGPSGGGSTGGTNPDSGGCSWQTSFVDLTGNIRSVCSSGCPTNYPNQQYTCCASAGGGCNPGTSTCRSYNPIVGETPCCTSGGYYTCTKQEICTEGGCKNVCTGADKTSDLYCSKCNSCQDGVQNCGETAVDKGGPNCGQPCTISTVHSYTTPGTYGSGTCASLGNSKCQAYAPSGYYNIQCLSLASCSAGSYGCVWNCQGTHDDFNVASCSDGVQNCGETCVDGGPQCNAGAKETDNSYPVSFDYTQPAGLSSTRLYSDAASWNCADGIDNDHDCLVDCADPDCASSYACTDKTPPVTTLSLSGKQANGWYASGTSATLSCQDDISGCKDTYYCTDTANACAPSTKYSAPFSIGSSGFVRFYSNDKAKNTEAVKSREVKIDGNPPSVSVSALPAAPCTLSPLTDWIDCSATSYVVCSDGESGCDSGTYMLKSYQSSPGTCPAAKGQYGSANSLLIKNDQWVCAYAEDAIGNAKVSSPTEIKVNRTFAIAIDAKASGEIDVPAGSAVKAYLCDASQYYCNQDAQYLATSSGTVGADKNFRITFVLELDRGTKYKIGVVTEKGYAENEFVA